MTLKGNGTKEKVGVIFKIIFSVMFSYSINIQLKGKVDNLG